MNRLLSWLIIICAQWCNKKRVKWWWKVSVHLPHFYHQLFELIYESWVMTAFHFLMTLPASPFRHRRGNSILQSQNSSFILQLVNLWSGWPKSQDSGRRDLARQQSGNAEIISGDLENQSCTVCQLGCLFFGFVTGQRESEGEKGVRVRVTRIRCKHFMFEIH